MASSSFSAPLSQSPKKYDVFISFRGEDTRFNFTSHLYSALCGKKIYTYIDNELEKGDELWPSLEKAIEDSALFLVVFSENYASSTWCLKELAKILDCSRNQGLLVVPVFYRVDPSDVRKQSGSYGKAFEEHERKSNINEEQLNRWREALKYAANLSGCHCSFDRDEVELITEIVNDVIQKVGPKYQSEDYLKSLIGIHERMADVEWLLNKGSNNDGCQFIGIWGMGGLGKTTLAKALFNKLHFMYEGFCLLANVREESKKHGIDALRGKLLLKLLGEKESHIGMLDAINPYTMSRLGRKKVFIVLDDVDDLEQIENLVGRHEFGRGSKILITTRDRQVLAGIKVVDIYALKALNHDEAFHLFSISAFRNDYADKKIKKLAEKVTQYAEGNPLALKVLGSFLNGKNQEAWESHLGKLQKLPHPRINDILKLSLEGLDEEEKNIFLHITCFFYYYYDIEEAKKLLDACGYSTEIGLTRLEDIALLDIKKGRICMHNLIKEMGRQIVREDSLKYPTRCNIFWIFKKNSEILKKNMGSEAIEGMILNLSEVEEMRVIIEAFCSMPNLKFLKFYGDYMGHFENELTFPSGMKFLSKNLTLLNLVGYPLKSLPTFKGENLVEIEMPNSKLTKLWDGEQNLPNLSRIDLSGSEDLIELPNFSRATHLAEVDLCRCSKLRSVHPSILSLHSLRHLWLRYCEALTSLTSNTHLSSLIDLDLLGCSRLGEFSVTSENSMFYLKLSGTAINGELCSSSGHLSKIEVLELTSCESLTSIHKLFDLRSLQFLDADCCNKLASNLRSTFDEMRDLEVLWLRRCSELFVVPDNIGLLSSLRELDLSRSSIETLPFSFKHLSSLRVLVLNCERLRSIPELPPSIKKLVAISGLIHVPFFQPLRGRDRGGEKYIQILLDNCMKLDGQSIKAIEAKVLPGINKAIYREVVMKYPGQRVPEWFMYRSTQCCFGITVNLLSIPQPWDGCFIFCAVINFSSPKGIGIEARLFIDGQYACTSGSSQVLHGPRRLWSDHVCLWYDPESCRTLQRRIEEKKRKAQSNTYHPLLQIKFFAVSGRYDETRGEIKECGVCPTSAVEYQNYIKQVQLASHPHPNSRKRKYHSLLR